MKYATWLALITLSFAANLEAQWVEHRYDLTQGWNAIWLSVQPVPPECERVFGQRPEIDQVCTYLNTFSSVQYVDSLADADPANALPGWLRWQPGSTIPGLSRGFHSARAGRAYLVRTTNACTLTVTGRPVTPILEWRPDCFNMAGFHFSNAPTNFTTFFGSAAGLQTTNIYRLTTNGIWGNVTASSTAMRSGEAFWIKTSGLPSFQGRPAVTYPSPASLDFGSTATELALALSTNGAATVTIERRSSVACGSDPDYTSFAGSLSNALAVWNPAGSGSWQLITNNSPVGIGLSATDCRLRFAVFRHLLPRWEGSGSPLFADIVRLTVPGGNTVEVPVRALGEPLVYTAAPSPVKRAGLWVGEVCVSAVSQPNTNDAASHIDPPAPVDSANPFRFRILLHVDTNGTPRLLRQAVLGWVPPVYAAPDTNGFRSVATNGHHVLCENAAQFTVSGAGFVTRVSAPVFGFDRPLAPVSTTTNALRFVVATPWNHALHPYRHAAHPDHDGKKIVDNDYDDLKPLTNTVAITSTNRLGEVWARTHEDIHNDELSGITRSIELTFADLPDDAAPNWNDTTLAGVWSEVLTGLHQRALRVEGLFTLNRISTVTAFIRPEETP